MGIEMIRDAKNLELVEAFDNEDELYEDRVFQDLWNQGIVVHDDDVTLMDQGQEEDTEQDIQSQYDREKKKADRAREIYQWSTREKEKAPKEKGATKPLSSMFKNRKAKDVLNEHLKQRLEKTRLGNGAVTARRGTARERRKTAH